MQCTYYTSTQKVQLFGYQMVSKFKPANLKGSPWSEESPQAGVDFLGLDSADILPLLEGEGGCVLHFLFKVLLGGGLSGSGMWRDRSFFLQTIYLCFLRFLHG